ncbi:anti-sigma factor [Rudanella lutea]|uniref:anti-sigma factor n=1 Tax=Rudanella lutea TaxID=451374 RepID=UPI0003A63A53|nr:anti-sigma factor [Rudanella lutea]
MDVSEYIASGTLELYALGAASDQERREVECLASIYPEIRQELDQLTEAMERYALVHSVDPPADLKEAIMSKLSFEPAPVQEPIVKPMPVSRPTFQFTWVAAASVGLILLSFALFLVNQLRESQQVQSSLRSTNNSLQDEIRQLRDRQQSADAAIALLKQPGTRVIQVLGNDKAPNGRLAVYWNAQLKQVAVEVGSLPKLAENQQYQLWSLVDGKPVDAGVFENLPTNGQLQRTNRSIGAADAFAVTIERRGGSPTPTLTALVAVGQVG